MRVWKGENNDELFMEDESYGVGTILIYLLGGKLNSSKN